MNKIFNVVAVSGSVFKPSRTQVLAESILSQLSQSLPIKTQLIELGDVVAEIGPALTRKSLSQEVEEKLRTIENADLLVVATPVYRGSYPGQFKHLFDLIDQNALIDTPVLLAATGGSHRHALVIEHQLRPLFSFFQALTLPVGVYASEADFSNYVIVSDALKARIELAVTRAQHTFSLLTGHSPLRKIA